jgi:nucleoside-diphosphate-sugar epimerase
MSDAVLITGADGFIGRHLRAALESAGNVVYPHDRGDGDIARCALNYTGVKHVFHLAGKTFVPDSWTTPLDFYEVNVLGTVNVLEFCRRANAAITFISSYVYGIPESLPISEEHPLGAFNPYSHTKILAEETVGYYQLQFGVRATIVRPFNIYGSGQAEHFLIPKLIRQALDPKTTEFVVNDLRPRRDYIHVRDLVALLLSTLACGCGGVFNAGSGYSVSIQDVVETIESLTDCRKEVRSLGQMRADEVLDVVADISKAKREFGWQPVIGLKEGLREMIDCGVSSGYAQ